MFYKLIYRARLGRQAKLVDLFTRAEAALRDAGVGPTPIRLCLEDGPARERSAVKRVVRPFPALAGARTDGGVESAIPLAVSSLAPPWTPHAPSEPPPEVSPEMAAEIAAGIPSRWPLDSAMFLFEMGAWPHLEPPPAGLVPMLPHGQPCPQWPAAYWRPAVCVSTRTSSSGRLHDVVAIVPLLPSPPPSARKLSLPEAVVRVLQALGPAGSMTVEPVRTPSEQAAANELQARLSHMVATDEPLIHELPAALTVTPARPEDLPSGPPAVKAPLAHALRPFGLAYVRSQSGQGMYVFSKETPRGHELALNVDAAPLSRTLWAYASFRASGLSFLLPVPLAPGGGRQALDPPERLAELLSNLVRVLGHYQTSLLPRLEAELGEGARWLGAVGRTLT